MTRRYTLAQLEALRCVVKFRTFQAAADHLNVTQPTISLRIRELEQIVGYPLLRRSGGRGALTAEGETFFQYVETMMRTLDEMDRRVRPRDPMRGVLRLGASETFAIAFLPELLSRLEDQYPQLRVDVTLQHSSQLGAKLDAKELDLALMAEVPVDKHVHVQPLAGCEMAWFGRPEWSGAKPLSAKDLEGRRVVTLPVGSPMHAMTVAWFEASNAPAPALSICNSLSLIVRLTNSGHAWSVLPRCFGVSGENGAMPKPASAHPKLSAVRLCAAYQTGGSDDTLAPLVEMARSLLAGRPGIIPL
ncbi:MAG TPA: LysR family transcriptional regulator [Ramlibacter sp.]|nr:LysR family transcriptional regulator [Ramlibacter sp.]